MLFCLHLHNFGENLSKSCLKVHVNAQTCDKVPTSFHGGAKNNSNANGNRETNKRTKMRESKKKLKVYCTVKYALWVRGTAQGRRGHHLGAFCCGGVG